MNEFLYKLMRSNGIAARLDEDIGVTFMNLTEQIEQDNWRDSNRHLTSIRSDFSKELNKGLIELNFSDEE